MASKPNAVANENVLRKYFAILQDLMLLEFIGILSREHVLQNVSEFGALNFQELLAAAICVLSLTGTGQMEC